MSILEVKLIESIEIDDLYNLLLEFRPPLAGLKNRRIYKAMCQELLKNDKILTVIAKVDKTIAGFSITIIDWKKFWLEFSLSHPALAGEIFIRKVAEKFKLNKKKYLHYDVEEEIKEFLSNKQTQKAWGDSSPQIAKIVYVGVTESYRNMGIGKMIANYRFRVLNERGVVRIDSIVDPKNISAIKLNYKLGYKIYKSGMKLFASKDLM